MASEPFVTPWTQLCRGVSLAIFLGAIAWAGEPTVFSMEAKLIAFFAVACILFAFVRQIIR